jgi:hypothetical protein
LTRSHWLVVETTAVHCTSPISRNKFRIGRAGGRFVYHSTAIPLLSVSRLPPNRTSRQSLLWSRMPFIRLIFLRYFSILPTFKIFAVIFPDDFPVPDYGRPGFRARGSQVAPATRNLSPSTRVVSQRERGDLVLPEKSAKQLLRFSSPDRP